MSGPSDCHLGELHAMLRKLVESKPGSRVNAQEEEAEDPMVRRVFLGGDKSKSKIAFENQFAGIGIELLNHWV